MVVSWEIGGSYAEKTKKKKDEKKRKNGDWSGSEENWRSNSTINVQKMVYDSVRNHYLENLYKI